MIVRDLDEIEIDGAQLVHLENQEVGVSFPTRSTGIGRAATALEEVPFPRQVRRNHVRRVDLGKSRRLAPLRAARQDRACGQAGSRFEKGPSRWSIHRRTRLRAVYCNCCSGTSSAHFTE